MAKTRDCLRCIFIKLYYHKCVIKMTIWYIQNDKFEILKKEVTRHALKFTFLVLWLFFHSFSLVFSTTITHIVVVESVYYIADDHQIMARQPVLYALQDDITVLSSYFKILYKFFLVLIVIYVYFCNLCFLFFDIHYIMI